MPGMSFRKRRGLFFVVAMSGILLGAPGAWANDTEGFFAGVRFGYELADAEHTKRVDFNPGVLQSQPGGSSKAIKEKGEDGFNAFMANVGYRAFLSDRVYLSGEVEGAIYSNTVQGVIRGTFRGTAPVIPSEEVFPGAWKVEKNHSIGFNARLGYVPQGLAFLGEGRSIYLISGVKWLDATFESSYDNRARGEDHIVIRGVSRRTRDAVPWLIGGGLEFGSSTNRFDVRVHYSSWNMDSASGDGSREDNAYLRYNFDVEEVGISLGYTRSFTLGM